MKTSKSPKDLYALLSIAAIACVMFASCVLAFFWLFGAFDRPAASEGATATGDSLERGCGMVFLSTYDKPSGELSRRELDDAAVCNATGNYHEPRFARVISPEQSERNRRDMEELYKRTPALRR